MAKTQPAKQYWLLKSEPSVYSIDHLARDGRTSWEGVRNYMARNHLRTMKAGDLAFFYHSSADPTGVAGVVRIAKEAYPDPAQFDAKNDYYDAKSPKNDPRWFTVDVEYLEKLPRVVSLPELKADAALEGMPVLARGQRLSVQPVSEKHFKHILAMSKKAP